MDIRDCKKIADELKERVENVVSEFLKNYALDSQFNSIKNTASQIASYSPLGLDRDLAHINELKEGAVRTVCFFKNIGWTEAFEKFNSMYLSHK